jgi:hypothetical protein
LARDDGGTLDGSDRASSTRSVRAALGEQDALEGDALD